MSRPVLILDIGGVVFADPLADLFDQLCQASSKHRAEITDFYSTYLRRPLWSGQMTESGFWLQILGECGLPLEVEPWRTFLLRAMHPLPAADHLDEWRATADLWLLSNHRTEWLEPAIATLPSDPFASKYISSVTGHIKPDADAFADVVGGVGTRHAIFVDDKSSNVDAADALGLHGIVADSNGDWLELVSAWLELRTRLPQ